MLQATVEDVCQGLKAAMRVPREAAGAELVLDEQDERVPTGHVGRQKHPAVVA
jgi:hypothetical protein